MKLPTQATGQMRFGRTRTKHFGAIRAAEIVLGSDGKFYSCRPKYVEGPTTYYDCRGLELDNGGGIYEPPGYCWTETECVLGIEFCQEHCIPPWGSETTGDWYPCGACIDIEFAQRVTSPAAARTFRR